MSGSFDDLDEILKSIYLQLIVFWLTLPILYAETVVPLTAVL
jgi:hypothetical protein